MSDPTLPDIRQILTDNAIRDLLAYDQLYEPEYNYEREERPPIEPFWSELQRMSETADRIGEVVESDHELSWYEREWRRAEEAQRQQELNVDEDFLRELRNLGNELDSRPHAEDEIIVDYGPTFHDDNTPEGRDIWGVWFRVGPKLYPRRFIRDLAYKLWQKAGCPDGRSEEFWLEAEKMLDKRGFGAAGVGGFCPTDSEMAKKEAIRQFLRRREYAIREGQIDNSSLPAGYPLYFYCNHCGILLETLPEDYIFRPRRQCSQCKGLSQMRWLQLAKEAAQESHLPLPTPMKYTEKRKEA